MNGNQIISRRDVEGLIADGQLLVIYEGCLLKLDSWLDKHPGGNLPILHMVGRDATDEINAYHFPNTLLRMTAYRIGQVRQPWVNFVPPLRGGVYRRHSNLDTIEVDASRIDEESTWSASSISVGLSISGFASMHVKTEKTTREINVDEEELPGRGVPVMCTHRTLSISNVHGMSYHTHEKQDMDSGEKLCRAAYTAALEQKEIGDDIRDYPSLDVETQRAIVLEYQALHDRVKREGFYECHYSEYGKEAIRYSVLFCIFLYLLNAKWYLISACFLGMFWQQIMFTAHDAGHRGITGNYIADTLIGAFIADFCCGLSIGWWKSSHNVHHLITNMPEHDPDLQNVPLFATSPTFFKSVLSTFYNFSFVWGASADFIARYQKFTYYPIMAIARFNLYLLSWLHLMSPRAASPGSVWWMLPVEITMMGCYWAIFGYGLLWCTLPTWPIRFAFVFISHTITMLLHIQITLSHWGMPTSDLGPTESFPQRQLRTTMDIDCPPWLDFLHGGLQFQAVHHLFPRVPRHNLRHLQLLVREFCDKTHIKYKCYGFIRGNEIVLSRLEEVAKMVEMLILCQKDMAEIGKSGLH